MTKNQLIVVGFLIIIGVVDYMILKPRVSLSDSQRDLRSFSLAELAKYDGTKSELPVYLGLDGLVYDVSAGRDDFYNPGESYHYLVGKDASKWLHIFGADLIKNKYPVVGKYQ